MFFCKKYYLIEPDARDEPETTLTGNVDGKLLWMTKLVSRNHVLLI